jgi:hypothetical protein
MVYDEDLTPSHRRGASRSVLETTMNTCRKLSGALCVLVLLAIAPIGAAWAQVQVTAADPSTAPQGTVSLDVAISGSGFDSTAIVRFLAAGTNDTGGITVKKVAVRGSRKLVATIDVGDTALIGAFDIEVALSSGRKGKGTTLFAVLKTSSDPCATPGLDFPAFAFWRPAGQGLQIFVADTTGQCVRSVTSGTGIGGTLEFSYPVVGTDGVPRGRVAWLDGPDVVAVDFSIAAGTNSIAADPRRTVYPQSGGYISLSRDGHTLYANNYTESGGTVINRLRLDPPLGDPEQVFSTSDPSSFPTVFSVNANETLLFADYATYSGGSSLKELVWIPLDGTNTINPIDSNTMQLEHSPAADPDSSNRVAYQKRTDSSGTCQALVVSDVNGHPTYPAQLALGIKPTWVNGSIVADGRALGRRGSCPYTGTIMRTDPVTGVQTALTQGYDPDGAD